MINDKRLADMFIPLEERLTELEMQPGFPFPIETTIIITKDNWQFLRNLIRRSYDAVKDTFKGTSLEYKIGLYKESMPTEEEDAMGFLRRNQQKYGVIGPYDDLILGVTDFIITEEGKKITLEPGNNFSTRLYTGEKPTIIDHYTEKENIDIKKGKYKIYKDHFRTSHLQEKYEVEFEVGFKHDLNENGKKLWFYSFNYRNPDFRQLYEKLCKSIIRCNDLSSFKREAVNYQKFGVLNLFH